MSDSPQQDRLWAIYVRDMIQYAKRALSYTRGLNQKAFLSDNLRYDATLRNIELIGEAADNIPDWVKESYPHIVWKQIVGTRHRVAHVYSTIIDNYSGIDNSVIWDIIENHLPALIPQLEKLLADQECEKP